MTYILSNSFWRKDYLLIRDHKNEIIGKFCGNSYPRELLLIGNNATLIFRSNKRKNFAGFSIKWSAEKGKIDGKTEYIVF